MTYNGIVIKPAEPGDKVSTRWASDWIELTEDACECLISIDREKAFNQNRIANNDRYDYINRNSNNSLKCYLGDCKINIKWSVLPIGWGSPNLKDCDKGCKQ